VRDYVQEKKDVRARFTSVLDITDFVHSICRRKSATQVISACFVHDISTDSGTDGEDKPNKKYRYNPICKTMTDKATDTTTVRLIHEFHVKQTLTVDRRKARVWVRAVSYRHSRS
jgi:hypothetical protein